MPHCQDLEQELARLRHVPAFNRSHEGRVVPKPGVRRPPRDSHALEWRAYDPAKGEWSEWSAIHPDDSRVRWPDEPIAPPAPQTPPELPNSLDPRLRAYLDRLEARVAALEKTEAP